MASDLGYWILLDFFVLEMKAVRDYVECKGREEFERKLIENKRLRKVLLPI